MLKLMTQMKRVFFTFVIGACSVGTLSAKDRSLTHEQKMEILEKRISEMPEDVLNNVDPLVCHSITPYDERFLDKIHKLAYYAPNAIYNMGQTVELFDLSKWYIHPLHKATVRSWVKSDTIFIKPRSSCFSMYDYVLYNRTTNEAVEANFSNIPRQYQLFSQRIAKIDYYQRWVQLDDPEGTVWQINYSEYGFDNWRKGDYIIVGVNNDWRIAAYPHILINGSLSGSYCEGSFYGYTLN